MKILITGGCGFIGSNLVRMAIKSGFEVINIDKLTYAGNPLSLKGLSQNPRYTFIEADICDQTTMSTVLNLAAESHVDRSIDSPEPFIRTNILGAFSLLEASRDYWKTLSSKDREAFRFIHISTDEVYGSLGPEGYFTENTAYDPRSPYSASKASSDHIARSYFHTYEFPSIITNCTNNYGPFQFPEKLIPHVILSALEEKPLPVYGDGSNVRDWIHVDDHCRGLLSVLEKGVPGETYAIGADSERTNLHVVLTICKKLDQKKPRNDGLSYENLISFVQDRPGHDRRYAIDAGKMRNKLGWNPQITLEEGLDATIDWYLKNTDWTNSILSGSYKIERLGLKGDDCL